MNRRLDRHPSNVLGEWIGSLERDIHQLKTGNQGIGPDSLVVNLNATGNDLDIVDVAVSANTTAVWRVTFTPDQASDAYAELSYGYAISGGNGFEAVQMTPDTSVSTSSQAWLWALSTSGNNVTVGAVFGVKCVDTGTIAVVRVS